MAECTVGQADSYLVTGGRAVWPGAHPQHTGSHRGAAWWALTCSLCSSAGQPPQGPGCWCPWVHDPVWSGLVDRRTVRVICDVVQHCHTHLICDWLHTALYQCLKWIHDTFTWSWLNRLLFFFLIYPIMISVCVCVCVCVCVRAPRMEMNFFVHLPLWLVNSKIYQPLLYSSVHVYSAMPRNIVFLHIVFPDRYLLPELIIQILHSK